ncbi:O-antigen ligase family protein [Eionea flava]
MINTPIKNNSAIFYGLCGLALSLPIIEVTKHLFILILVVFFIYDLLLKKLNFEQSYPTKCIYIFLTGSIIASIGATLNGYEVQKLHDIIRYGLVGLIILYAPISKKQAYIILGCLIFSALAGILDAYHSLHQGKEKYFELRSVGHINHSSIYILLTVGLTLPLLFSIKHRVISILTYATINAALIYSLLETNSRATFIGLGIIILLLVIFSALRSKKIACISLAITIFGIMLTIWNPPSALNKIYGKSKYYENKLTPREKAWNTAYHAWKKEYLFGVGYGNYKIITEKFMQEQYINSEIDTADKTAFIYLPHAHNRFFNTLAEGGLIGLLSLLLLLAGFAVYFFSSLRISSSNKDTFTFWLIGFNSLTIISIVGLFNTTLHHEHGILAMILLCLSVNQVMRYKRDNHQKSFQKKHTADIIFVTKGETAPSFRHRLVPLIQALEKKGYNCLTITLTNSWYVWRILKYKHAYQNCNAVILHKLLLPKIETKLLHSLNSSIILDIDDAIYLKEPKWVGHNRKSPKSRKNKFIYMVKTCEAVVTGNKVLLKEIKDFSKNIHVIPTGTEKNTYVDKKNTYNLPCTIVWIGLPSNLRYLEILRDTFTQLTEKYSNIRIKVICSEFPDWQDIKIEKVKWSTDIESKALAQSHIGIMPLDDSEYSRGKCAFKLLQYMSAGLPCVASPVGANCDVISNGNNGYLAHSTKEWIEKLSLLIENPEQRLAMGIEGQRVVQEKYSKTNIAKSYRDIVIKTITTNCHKK